MSTVIKLKCENCYRYETEDEDRAGRSRFRWINDFEMNHVDCPEPEPRPATDIIIIAQEFAQNGSIVATGGAGGAVASGSSGGASEPSPKGEGAA